MNLIFETFYVFDPFLSMDTFLILIFVVKTIVYFRAKALRHIRTQILILFRGIITLHNFDVDPGIHPIWL